MKKIISTLIISTIILTSCGKTGEVKSDKISETKKDFLIETKTINDFSNTFTITKNWKITSQNELNIVSQASWKVSKILKKEWDKVSSWENIIILDDNISNYGINIQKAKNNIDKLSLSYETNKINLQKNIDDLKITLEKLNISHNTLLADSKIKLKKAEYDYNSNINNSDITKDKNILDIEKLEKDLQKATLDYENSIKSDENNISSFRENIKTLYSQKELIKVDITSFLDETFWVSETNKTKNDSYEIYIWAKNSSLKTELENKILQLLSESNKINIDYNSLNEEEIKKEFEKLEEDINNIKSIISLAEEVMRNSISSSSFTQTIIDGFLNNLNNFSNSTQSIYSQVLSSKTNTNNFLNTYLDLRKSREKQIDILKDQITLSKKQIDLWNINTSSSLEGTKTSLERIKIQIENDIKNSEIWLKQAKTNLDNAIQNKELTLQNIDLSIKEAKINLEEMHKNYNKLIIKAPFDWYIKDILVDVWQDISTWRELLSFVWNSLNQIEFFVNSDELPYFYVWLTWSINYNSKNINWEIINIWNVWNEKFNFKITLKILEKIDIVWDLAKIVFDIKSKNQILDINLIKITWNSTWIINILQNNKIFFKEVDLWKSFDKKIEILTPLKEDEKIIITDIKNFDENKFNLKIKQ